MITLAALHVKGRPALSFYILETVTYLDKFWLSLTLLLSSPVSISSSS